MCKIESHYLLSVYKMGGIGLPSVYIFLEFVESCFLRDMHWSSILSELLLTAMSSSSVS